ncbi:FAD-dependent oxidoreductase, partial [Bacillus cereus]|nr:FAD-dependent oxidoreductase [Bacillus cereus]
IKVNEHLLVEGQDRIFAAGDAAIIEGNALAQQAQPPIQMGRHGAKQIKALGTGEPLKPFEYHDKGTMATIGRSAAVVQ